jgi:hypothetical protein
MANDLNAKVVLTGEDKTKPATDSAKKNLQGISTETKKTGVSAEKSAEKIDRSNNKATKSFGGLLSGISKVKLGLFAFAAVVAGVVLSVKKWTSATIVQELAEAKLSRTLSNLTQASSSQIQALKNQASALQQLTGFQDQQTLSAQATLGSFKLTAEQIQNLTPRLLDLAESTRKAGDENIDLQSIATDLGKTLKDGIGSLEGYGVAMSDAQKQSFELADQSQKVAILTKVLDANFKGLAQSIGGTYAGEVRKGDAAQAGFIETLGKLFTQNSAFTEVS